MRWIAIAAVALIVVTSAASARTTRAPFSTAARTTTRGVRKRSRTPAAPWSKASKRARKLCLPQGLSDVAPRRCGDYWIGEQIPSLDHEPERGKHCRGPRGALRMRRPKRTGRTLSP